MSIRSGGGRRSILRVVLVTLSLCMIATVPVVAQDQAAPSVIEQRATFPVSEPPAAPFHAHQSMLLFVPGAEAPLHHHGGPGYITILDGELILYEDGVENTYQAGQSLVETPDKLYKGGNYSDRDTVLMVTYLVPEGAEVTTVVEDPEAPEPPEIGPEPLAETMHEFTDPPASFELIHTVRVYPPQAGSDPTVANGETLLSVIAGTLALTIDGQEQTLGPGDALVLEAGQEYGIDNHGDSDALTMSTELAPDTYSMAPDAGSTVDRTLALWLLIMAGGAVLVIGAVLRFAVVRPR